ncbi:sigma-70 family RNA polymerase sigma factor [Aeromicrobium sp. CFBP 8757]|uniref:RNA polymerase sigma factor n=1 Tax=Aeromicrobium sp. CFBP 8757 TaxID=2775288 RepID=UPI0017813C3F|nr:sigma-70 family RNA polymerase sigma factor [Aeromicrobium sp. CFBP 8757]MBD8607888.1 sigma-70 family RNA polymerase sigma factor [Aeromicrobium sp. CFBP 8757]
MDPGAALGIRLAQQDEGALADVYAAYGSGLRSYLSRFVGPDEADDVLQRTMLDVWLSAGRYDTSQRLSTWLFMIAHRRAVDTLRARRHDIVDVDLARDLVGEDGREMAERHADAAEVRVAMNRLPEHERIVLELVYFSGLTHREIADRLDVPQGTVKARASRGTHRLSALIRAVDTYAGAS